MSSIPTASPLSHSFPTRTNSQSPFNIPSPLRQSIFFLTGSFAGAVSLAPSYLLLSSPQPRTPFGAFVRTNLAPTLLRTGLRFWVFDLVRLNLPTSWFDKKTPPAWQVGAIGGAYGGALEVLVASAIWRPKTIPTLPENTAKNPVLRRGLEWLNATTRPASLQGLKLFMCFGMYNYLSHRGEQGELPPRSFWRCWGMAAVAGAAGGGIVGVLEQRINEQVAVQKPSDLIKIGLRHAGKGAAIIGTVIAVQATSCATALRWTDA
ncbi:hypothetical protein EV356DRAFT_130923 [Viridothelium virens]|uniref:Uncharacterized protein n=1 Tax=Viridothelium virens TaxID=1048519 RepID=A0A6A6HBI9_VIRVR|nr:hypothetical protein EV356DRAFT_130923 [Viridothelium virens]